MLSADTTFSWYKHRKSKCTSYLSKKNSLVYIFGDKDLIEKLGTAYYSID